MNIVDDPNQTDGFQLRLSLFFAALFFSIGCYLPYFPVWLTYKGLNPQEVALVLAVPMWVRVVFAPLISVWADYEGNYRKILIILALGSFIALCALWFANGFVWLVLVTGVYAIFGSAIIPLSETIAMSASRAKRLHYGRARSWGSFAFIVASFGAGVLVERFDGGVVLSVLLIAGAAIVAAAFSLPRPTGKGRLRRAVAKGRFSGAALGVLMKNKLFWLFLVASGLAQASHAFYYGFSTLHWQSIGMSGGVIGALWALGVIAEIILFVVAGGWLRDKNPLLLIGFGAMAAALRWGLSGFDPHSLWVWAPLQVLHAFSFGLVHLGAMFFISDVIDERLGATAQGLHATVTAGVIMGALVMASGPLYEWGAAQGYFVMMGSALLAVALLLFLNNRWDGGPLGEAPGLQISPKDHAKAA